MEGPRRKDGGHQGEEGGGGRAVGALEPGRRAAGEEQPLGSAGQRSLGTTVTAQGDSLTSATDGGTEVTAVFGVLLEFSHFQVAS